MLEIGSRLTIGWEIHMTRAHLVRVMYKMEPLAKVTPIDILKS